MTKKGEKVFILILIGIFLLLFLAQFGFFQFTGNSILKFFSTGKAVDDPLIIPITECGVLDQEGATYILQNDILDVEGDCFKIQARNLNFIGNGYRVSSVYPTVGYSNFLYGNFIQGINVSGFHIENFYFGIHLERSHYNSFFSNSFINVTRSLNLNLAQNNSFHDNYFFNTSFRHMVLVSSPYNLFFLNYFDSSLIGVSGFSKEFIFLNNSLKGNYWEDFSDSCEDLDGDGLCDSPFVISSLLKDELPLSVVPETFYNPLSSCHLIGPFIISNIQKNWVYFDINEDALLNEEDISLIYYYLPRNKGGLGQSVGEKFEGRILEAMDYLDVNEDERVDRADLLLISRTFDDCDLINFELNYFGDGTFENPYLINSCQVLNESGYYKVYNDILVNSSLKSCLEINASDIILDFNNKIIDCLYRNCTHGLELIEVSNVSIFNGSIFGNSYGLYIENSFNIFVKDFVFYNNSNFNLYPLNVQNLVLENVLGENNFPILYFNESVEISNWNNNFSQLIFVDVFDLSLKNILYDSEVSSNVLYFKNVSVADIYNVSISTNSSSQFGIIFVSSGYGFSFNNLKIDCLYNSNSTGLKLINVPFSNVYFSNFSNCRSAISQENISNFVSSQSVFKNNFKGFSFDSGPVYFSQILSGLSFFETTNPFSFNVVAPTLFDYFYFSSPKFEYSDSSLGNLFSFVSDISIFSIENFILYFSPNSSRNDVYPLVIFNDFEKENLSVSLTNFSFKEFEYGDNYIYLNPEKFSDINVINGSAEIYFDLDNSLFPSPIVNYNEELCLPSQCFDLRFSNEEKGIFYLNVSSVLGNYSFFNGEDIYPPKIFNLENFTFYLGENIVILLDLWDNVEIDSVWLNDSRFRIDEDYTLMNNQTLALGVYWLNLSLNDTSGNLNSEVFFIEILEKPFSFTPGVSKVTYRVTSSDIERGKVSRSLSSNDVLELIYPERTYRLEGFNLDNINKKVNLLLSGVVDGSFSLNEGESKKIDLNNNGYYDLVLTLLGVSSRNFRILLEGTNERVLSFGAGTTLVDDSSEKPSIIPTFVPQTIQETFRDRTPLFWAFVGFLVFFIVLFIILIIYRYKNKKDSFFYA